MTELTAAEVADFERVRTVPARRGRWFFFGAALMMTALVLFAFSSTFYLKGYAIAPQPLPFPLPIYMIAHGCVMTAWCLFFVVQTWLVASGRTMQHRSMGWVGAVLAAAVVAMGLYTTLSIVSFRTAAGLPAEAVVRFGMHMVVISNLILLPCFAGLVTAAVLLRRRREWHGRLMYWAFVLSIGPAFGGGGARMLGPLVEGYLGVPSVFVWLVVPIVALLLHDVAIRRRIHPATVLGWVPLAAVVFAGGLIAGTDAGKAFVIGLG